MQPYKKNKIHHHRHDYNCNNNNHHHHDGGKYTTGTTTTNTNTITKTRKQPFPSFEMAYETDITHNKIIVEAPSMVLAIPTGKKAFLWHQPDGSTDLLEYDVKQRRILRRESVDNNETSSSSSSPSLYHDTILFGSILPLSKRQKARLQNETDEQKQKNIRRVFLTEDIYRWEGEDLFALGWGERCDRLCSYFDRMRTAPNNTNTNTNTNQKIIVAAPLMWFVNEGNRYQTFLPETVARPGYFIHHLQYREIYRVAPYYRFALTTTNTNSTNTNTNTNGEEEPHTNDNEPILPKDASSATLREKAGAQESLPKDASPLQGESLPKDVSISPLDMGESTKHLLSKINILPPLPRFIFANAQFQPQTSTSLWVEADPQQNDIYRLYAHGPNKSRIFMGLALVHTYACSQWLHSLFRPLRPFSKGPVDIRNVDYIEDSDVEEKEAEDDKEYDCNKTKEIKNRNTQAILLQCQYNPTFRRWIPVAISEQRNAVHISRFTTPDALRNDNQFPNSGLQKHSQQHPQQQCNPNPRKRPPPAPQHSSSLQQVLDSKTDGSQWQQNWREPGKNNHHHHKKKHQKASAGGHKTY